jgi:hypothetical protein
LGVRYRRIRGAQEGKPRHVFEGAAGGFGCFENYDAAILLGQHACEGGPAESCTDYDYVISFCLRHDVNRSFS